MVKALLCAVVLAGAPQDGNPAKALFDKMEARLREAKSLSFKCRTDLSGEGVGSGFVQGQVVLEGKTKARAELKGFMNSAGRKFELTSDGRENKWFVSGFGDGGGPTPKRMNGSILTWMGRADMFNGLYMGMALEWAEVGLKPGKELAVSNFKMGEKGTVGKIPAQAVEFALVSKEADLECTVVLWIDTKRLVPLRKDIDVTGLGKIKERYTDIKIDAEIDPSKFALPK